ncbi:probable inactive leucine-rich repeat receptor-like protein kinase At3g03770 [Punica granatum]|uniref:Probable inactive leucine-rich repeat receptor-like protein kinase At3g03770 n=1 Tax=Punica granatum TaxID=22663 RepID=A0A6P8EMJ7_PUNGR|nr:probable inactive leucine-rich repeat receptor-like protein kinase At3g03770 [Punica granatum]
MGKFYLVHFLCLTWSLVFPGTHQLQSSQRQVLQQLRKHLEYPSQLEMWTTHGLDLCFLPPSPNVNLTCEKNSVTELQLVGDKFAASARRSFQGYAIPGQTLSQNFSMDSLVTTLVRLTSLRVLRLVSLGMWGSLPDKIHRLSSLEILDLNSNFLYGLVPPKISTMVKLQSLIFDDNYFNGSAPDWFDSLRNMTVLSLRSNRLSGQFPLSLEKIRAVSEVYLSGNEIDGKVPDLSGLSNLRVLNLSGNRFSSGLPEMPRSLIMASLGNNSFSGEIPKQYSQLSHLQFFDVSFNMLRGKPLAGLFSLPNITYLNFATNMLSGSLSVHTSCSKKLGFVDLSNNKLKGGLPACLRSQSGNRTVNSNGNCLSTDAENQHSESYCAEVPEMKPSRGENVGALVAVIGGSVVLICLLGFSILTLYMRCCSRGISGQRLLQKAAQDNSATGFSSQVLRSGKYISETTKMSTLDLPPCRSFSLQELEEATDNFDKTAFIGDGSYGKLYKGRLQNGLQVAVRCLPSKRYSIRNLRLRLDLLSKLRHPNLVCLLGHCIDASGQDEPGFDRVFLVYEYVTNGNFQTCVSGNNPDKALRWSERLDVLIGVARAVHFLHTGIIPGFFSNRLKSNNILLNEHRMAKLSDYGLSVISGEIDKDQVTGDSTKTWQKKSLEDDGYSFGFIILESFLGPSTSSRKETLLHKEMAALNSPEGRRQMVDPVVLATSSQDSLSVVISLAKKCISFEGSRPSFEDILWNLQYAAQVQGTAAGE